MARVSRVAGLIAFGCATCMAILLGAFVGDWWWAMVGRAWAHHWALGALLALVPAWLLATLLAHRQRV